MPEHTVIIGVLCTVFVRLDRNQGCLDTAWTALGQHLDSFLGAWRVLGRVFLGACTSVLGVANACNPTSYTEMSSKRLDTCFLAVPTVEGSATKIDLKV